MEKRLVHRTLLLILLMSTVAGLSTRLQADTGSCGGATITLPFTDVMGNAFFCQIAEAYFSGLANGTSATTYSPANNVTREQMAAFTTRTLDQSVKRSNPRAALGQWWINKTSNRFGTFTLHHNPQFLACDGRSIWASNTQSNIVSRADMKTGEEEGTLSGIPSPEQIVIVSGYIYIASFQTTGKIYYAFISQTGASTASAGYTTGPNPVGITFDGQNLWTANFGTGPNTGSISRNDVVGSTPTTFTTGYNQPVGILFDGTNLWVTDQGDNSLKRVDLNTGAVLQTIALSGSVQHPIFDGTNLWIPCNTPDNVYVVRGGSSGSVGTVLAQLTGNGLNGPFQAAFDGERICVTNAADTTVSLWKATDLSPITWVDVFPDPNFNSRGICSDGTTFFIGIRKQNGTSSYIVPL